MESYDRKDSHSIDADIGNLVRNEFGGFTMEDGFYFVSDPNQPVLESVKIKLNENEVLMDLEEISVDKAKKKDALSEIPDAVRAKNQVLRELTGFSVEDRKSNLRSSVINEDITEVGVDFDNSH